LHEDEGGVVGVDEGLGGEFAVPDVVVHAAVLGEHLHVVFVFAHLLYAFVQIFDEAVTASVFEP
jgi:hypothetical protein